jgi:beta-N-acetylhexosaminidase
VSGQRIAPGPVLIAIDGLELGPPDRERLLHPLVGGVILFASNFAHRDQLARLCLEIHLLREPRLLICVDHEGGRVQRFRDGFTRIPPMRRLGELWNSDPCLARSAAQAAGYVLAVELRGCGVDLSLTPVLDVDHGASTIIGDRAFHSDPAAIVDLAGSLIAGMRSAGMAAVGKHYPGHGFIAADSHLELPVDERSWETIELCDLIPFRALADTLGGIMPAHVLYPRVDGRPAGFSPLWIRDILRLRLGFVARSSVMTSAWRVPRAKAALMHERMRRWRRAAISSSHARPQVRMNCWRSFATPCRRKVGSGCLR